MVNNANNFFALKSDDEELELFEKLGKDRYMKSLGFTCVKNFSCPLCIYTTNGYNVIIFDKFEYNLPKIKEVGRLISLEMDLQKIIEKKEI